MAYLEWDDHNVEYHLNSLSSKFDENLHFPRYCIYDFSVTLLLVLNLWSVTSLAFKILVSVTADVNVLLLDIFVGLESNI